MVYKQRGRPPSTETLVRRQLGLPPKNAKQSLPAGDTYIIPNHSGIASHPEFKQEIGKYLKLDGTNSMSGKINFENSFSAHDGTPNKINLFSDQYGFGISGGALNYTVTSGALHGHRFYEGTNLICKFNNTNIDFNNHKLQNVTDPTNNQDAATKNYVNTQIGMIAFPPTPTFSSVLQAGNTSGSYNATMSTNKKMQFRDTGIYLNSPADGELNIVSDNILETQAVEYQSNRGQSVAPTRSLNTTYQATNSSLLVYGTVRCYWSDDNVGPNNVAYATCKTDSSSPPTTAVQTAGTNTAFYLVTANTFAQQDFAFSFFVKKGDYYRIDSTTVGGTTVTKIHWNEVQI